MSTTSVIIICVVCMLFSFLYGYSRGKSDGYILGYKQAKKDIKIKVPKKNCVFQSFLAKLLP